MKLVYSMALLLNLTLVARAAPPFDPAGAGNVGNGYGTQFINGQCLTNADCRSGCCASPTGICSGRDAQFLHGKTGCGFGAPPGSAISHNNTAGGPPFDQRGIRNVGNGHGRQFIRGQCLSDADCGSGCCAGPSGICSGSRESTRDGKTGCGFVSPAGPSLAAAAPQPSTTAPTNPNGGPPFNPAGQGNVGNGQGRQFITGQCLGDADCDSNCCAGPAGICSRRRDALQSGKTGCGFVSFQSLARM